MDEGHDGGNGHGDDDEEKPFYVCAKLLSGKSFVVDLSPSDARPECRGVMTTVATAKERIGVVEGLLPDMVRLIFAGKRLQDDRPLAHYNVRCGAQLHVVVSLCAKLFFPRAPVPDPASDVLTTDWHIIHSTTGSSKRTSSFFAFLFIYDFKIL
jgi:hypothetical protein